MNSEIPLRGPVLSRCLRMGKARQHFARTFSGSLLFIFHFGSRFLSTTILDGHKCGYDAAFRLLNVTNVNTANRAECFYVADSSLIGQITFRENETTTA